MTCNLEQRAAVYASVLPYTVGQSVAAWEAGEAMARETLDRARPFIGLVGARDIAGQGDAQLDCIAGLAYLMAVKAACPRGKIVTDMAGYIVRD